MTQRMSASCQQPNEFALSRAYGRTIGSSCCTREIADGADSSRIFQRESRSERIQSICENFVSRCQPYVSDEATEFDAESSFALSLVFDLLDVPAEVTEACTTVDAALPVFDLESKLLVDTSF